MEAGRFVVEQYCVNSTICAARLLEQGGGPREGEFDDIVFDKADGDIGTFSKALMNKELLGVKRHGKQLWLQMRGSGKPKDEVVNVLWHFGMTGSFRIKGEHVPLYRSRKEKDLTVWPPRFCKCELVFANGISLAFCDPRRLGRIRLRGIDVCQVPPISKLAPDPVLHGLDEVVLSQRLCKLGAAIKAILLDQEKLVSGVGNWIADEVLYQTHIHPETPGNSLPMEKVTELARKIEEICRLGCTHTTGKKEFPDHWLFNYRWEKTASKTMQQMDYYGNPITFINVGGRTSAVVLKLQRKSNWQKLELDDQKSASPVDAVVTAGTTAPHGGLYGLSGKKNSKKRTSSTSTSTPTNTSTARKRKHIEVKGEPGQEQQAAALSSSSSYSLRRSSRHITSDESGKMK